MNFDDTPQEAAFRAEARKWIDAMTPPYGLAPLVPLKEASVVGVLVPAGTPRPIIEKLRAAIVKVLAEPEIQARMRESGVIAIASKSPEDFKAYMDAETAKWTKVIEESGVRAD